MQTELFVEGEDGRVPINSTIALASSKFLFAGELMAKSLVHGGPAPNFMTEWLCSYIIDPSSIAEIPVDVHVIRNKKHKDMIFRVSLNSVIEVYMCTVFRVCAM